MVAFEERLPNSEGLGGVSMAELVRRSLRQNPSRVIVGLHALRRCCVMMTCLGLC